LQRKELAKELLTESEVLSVAHRQGFASLNEVNTAGWSGRNFLF